MTTMLALGEPAPWFYAEALNGNPRYGFDTAAGRWIVMLFMGSGAHVAPGIALELIQSNRDLFDDDRSCFFGITIDPSDAAQGRITQSLPGIRWFLDYDHAVSMRYGAVASHGNSINYVPHWLLLDPMLRVYRRAPLYSGAEIIDELRHLLIQPIETSVAPVLTVPGVLPPELCQQLIGIYERNGGVESGFVRDKDGITVESHNHKYKRRADCIIEDDRVLSLLKSRMSSVLRPMIKRAYQFDANRIERFIVACYDSNRGGHFRAHRDNTTKGTSHRKFACTINLNAENYEGGDLCFPEFGLRTYRAPTGGAIVFSCSLLHEAQRVTNGRRYAFLPFLYDDDGARTREANLASVSPEMQTYRSGLTQSQSTAIQGSGADRVGKGSDY